MQMNANVVRSGSGINNTCYGILWISATLFSKWGKRHTWRVWQRPNHKANWLGQSISKTTRFGQLTVSHGEYLQKVVRGGKSHAPSTGYSSLVREGNKGCTTWNELPEGLPWCKLPKILTLMMRVLCHATQCIKFCSSRGYLTAACPNCP